MVPLNQILLPFFQFIGHDFGFEFFLSDDFFFFLFRSILHKQFNLIFFLKIHSSKPNKQTKCFIKSSIKKLGEKRENCKEMKNFKNEQAQKLCTSYYHSRPFLFPPFFYVYVNACALSLLSLLCNVAFANWMIIHKDTILQFIINERKRLKKYGCKFTYQSEKNFLVSPIN